MKVRIVTKFDVQLLEYTLGQSGEKDYQRIPDLFDHVEVDDERYLVVDRTFNHAKNEVVIQVWKPLVEENWNEPEAKVDDEDDNEPETETEP